MTFLQTVSISAAEAGRSRDLLHRLRKDEIQAIVLHEAYTSSECDSIVADLQSNRHNFIRTHFPGPFKSSFLGMNLNLAEPDLQRYLAAVPAFRAALDDLLPGQLSFANRILALFSKLDDGRTYEAAPGPKPSSTYMPTTFRVHDEGGYIPAHFDNEQAARPSFQHLRSQIRGDVLSFVLTLSRAEKGGCLEVFDAKAQDFAVKFKNVDGPVKPSVQDLARVSFDVPAGTIVILRSGDRLHRVTPVIGTKQRWTACSFMAEARGSDRVYLWG